MIETKPVINDQNNRQLVLLTGLPATGKTTIGNYLKNNYGFLHIDFEDGTTIKQFEKDPENFLTNLNKYEKIVISWGFVPVKKHVLLIEFLTSKNFKHIWFQADYLSSLITFMRRDKVGNLVVYFAQLFRIHFSKITDKMSPKIVYVFSSLGGFRKYDHIIKDLEISLAK